MSRATSKTWADFMNSEYAQKELNKIEKEAQAAYSVNMERDPLYNADPGNKTELSKSVQTQGVSGGGGSNVGSGERGPLYTTTPGAVPGGQEQYADATVEGLEDVASAMMGVAQKEPTGQPLGTQDNQPESWTDGIQAMGDKKIKNFTKKAQEMMMGDMMMDGDKMMGNMMMDDEEEDEASLAKILSELEEENEDEDEESGDKMMGDKMMGDKMMGDKMMGGEMMMEPEGEMAFGSAQKKKTVALLKELVKIANECDAKGQFKDASEIDAVIKDEVKTLLAAQKKTLKK